MAVHDPCIFFDESLRGRERAFLIRERLNDRSSELGWRPADRLSLPSDLSLVHGHYTSPILRNETFVTLWWRSYASPSSTVSSLNALPACNERSAIIDSDNERVRYPSFGGKGAYGTNRLRLRGPGSALTS